jgi:hypothetical protein
VKEDGWEAIFKELMGFSTNGVEGNWIITSKERLWNLTLYHTQKFTQNRSNS